MKKIRFNKTVAVDINTSAGEIFSRGYNRWDEIRVNEILDLDNSFAAIVLDNDDEIIEISKEAFEVLDK